MATDNYHNRWISFEGRVPLDSRAIFTGFRDTNEGIGTSSSTEKDLGTDTAEPIGSPRNTRTKRKVAALLMGGIFVNVPVFIDGQPGIGWNERSNENDLRAL